MGEVFGHRRVYVSEPNSEFNDFIFFASDAPIAVHPEAASARTLDLLAEREFLGMTEGETIVTDDFNPLESLQVSKAETYRKVLLERVGLEVLLR